LAPLRYLASFPTRRSSDLSPGVIVADGAQPGKVLSAGQQDILKLSTEQRKRIADIQKEIDAKLETLLTEDQKKLLQAMRVSSPGDRKSTRLNSSHEWSSYA